ncbi:RNA-binding domain-containing protein [Xanthomonas sacchari]|uniref:RNA-binding domain-containing protein n=1 Tax=Xanthomonas sacchari TaxID=56458 RepID=UPI00299F5705|nr:RNA-binding domain-containing protein [Xanthomonas sacchari]MCW0466100.1 hypothetical protein [Xanthomonas sacchari]
MPFSDAQLLLLMEGLESSRVERKRSWSGDVSDKVRQAICAFANDLSGSGEEGVIFVGVEDDGTPSGLPITDELLLNLSHIKTDGKILPPPSLTVESHNLRGVDVAVITVRPADSPPVRYDGRIWVRIGPRRALASAQDERILSEKRRFNDRAFDARPIYDANIGDLNRVQFEGEYLPQAFAPDILSANGRSYEARLASLGFVSSVDEPIPTLTGILVLGKSPRTFVPGAYIQFLRINGNAWGDPVIDERDIDGSLDQMLRALDEKVRAHLAVSVNFASGSSQEIRESSYPISAIQQIVRNAVMHRNYEGSNAPIRVYWFNDRIEVYSPGGPYGVVNAANFGRPGITDYRNPHLASALRTMGFVQRFGFGLAEAKRSMDANGNPSPEYNVEQSVILATLRARQ